MAIAKMKLAKFSGKIEQLDDLIMQCCVDGNFHPEQASQYISSSMGYLPYQEQNPYKPLIQKLEDTASYAETELAGGDDLSDVMIDESTRDRLDEISEKVKAFADEKQSLSDEMESCTTGISILRHYEDFDIDLNTVENGEFFTVHYGRLPIDSYMKLTMGNGMSAEEFEGSIANIEMDAKTRNNILVQKSQFKSLADEKEELLSQKEKCENGISIFKYFEDLNVELDKLEECEFITVRFGKLPKVSYKKISEAYSDNPYVMFIPCSSDRDDYWGAYFAPKNQIEEIDRIFAGMHFEKYEMPGAAGEPKEVIANLEANLKIISARIAEIGKTMDDISEGKGFDQSRLSRNTDGIGNPYVMFIPCSMDKTHYWGAYFAPKEKDDRINQIFSELHFERFDIPGVSGLPREMIAQLNDKARDIQNKITDVENRRSAYWNQVKEECNGLYAALTDLSFAFEIKYYAVVRNGFFFLVGWITAASLRKLKKNFEALKGVNMDICSPDEDKTNEPPVKLKNLKIARPFEFFVDMYGLPGYNDVDVTSFVALTYTLIFGMMFGDVGQGFVLMIAGLLMWKLKNMALGKALIPCGFSSMCFGFVFGSVFGYEEMLDPLYKAVGMAGKPISVMDSVNTILIFAISIGIFLTALAMVLNVYACLKQKKVGEALFSQNGVTGLIFYLCGVSLAVEYMAHKTMIPNDIAVILVGVCAVLLFVKELLIGMIDHHSDWKPDSIGDFIAQNIFELLEYVLSYASNTVSFLRVGAFVLVHAGMMMVVFSLAGSSQNLFVIILGNVLVICLEGLLTGIQVLRLEFYEMFSRFYEGNGRPFRSVKIKRPKGRKIKFLYVNGGN